MAESFITQCPHCGTSFRVKNEQLSVANGSVRCGACLQVFSARNHVVTTSIPAQKSVQKPKAVPKAKPAAKPKAAPQRAAPSAKPKPKPAVRPKPALAKPAPPTRPKPPQHEDFGFTADDDDDAEFLFADGDDDDDYTFSDGPNDSLFDEDEQDEGFGELSDSFLNLSDSSKPQKKIDHFQRETQEMAQETFEAEDDAPDESWAESMLEEIEKEDKISTAQPAVFEPQEMGRSQNQPKRQTTTQSSMLMDFDQEYSKTGAIPAQKTSHQNPSASQVVNNASHEIELDFHADERLSRLRPLGWVAVFLLAVVLAAQLAWLSRDTYARMDQWRGLYQQACNVLKCNLPDQIDINAIRTSVLVREHKDPQMKDIRIVDVVLTNKAPFKQPFPSLLLQYTDVNGRLVADQSFLPDNYLKGELTGVELMPINTRVYISFPIKTPSQNAVNYQLLLSSSSN
jgi:predicted Zn finger-like uncharacterized protein